MDKKECPFYQVVCSLDESHTCFNSSDYKQCQIYKNEDERRAFEEITDDGEW